MLQKKYFRRMLQAKQIEKKYGALQVLKGVDLEIQKGEIVSIVGSSGAGKSTLLHILGTLDKPNKGEIILQNTRIDQLTGKSLARFRNKHIGFIFQFHHLTYLLLMQWQQLFELFLFFDIRCILHR